MRDGLRSGMVLVRAAGEHIGDTGNSGNSSGPHCHIHAMKGHRTRAERYWNYKAAYRIYPPSLVWAKTSL